MPVDLTASSYPGDPSCQISNALHHQPSSYRAYLAALLPPVAAHALPH